LNLQILSLFIFSQIQKWLIVLASFSINSKNGQKETNYPEELLKNIRLDDLYFRFNFSGGIDY